MRQIVGGFHGNFPKIPFINELSTPWERRMRANAVVLQLAAAMVVASAAAALQAPVPGGGGTALFQPLLADPKEPQFFATYLWAPSPRLPSRLGRVGLGQTARPLRGPRWPG